MTVYYRDEHVTLLLGDARDQLARLPDSSVDMICCSPPYYGLRDYGVTGQYGLEPTPQEYVERLRAAFAEARRVLADDGTLWLNLGDSYSVRWTSKRSAGRRGLNGDDNTRTRSGAITHGIPEKNLLGIPWRVAFALQDDGWILRSEIIWAKRNLMPEAVRDRPTQSHEQVFLFAKQARYFYDADAIREKSTSAAQDAHNQRYARPYEAHSARAATTGQPGNVNSVGIHSRPGKGGRNARTVWTISQTPNPRAHFATYPLELPVRCIKAGCRPGGTVLDPFSGSGTTGEAAVRLLCRYVGIDLNPAYHDLAIPRFAQLGFTFDMAGTAATAEG